MALQVGWEGPSECTFCPTLGVLRLRGLGSHLKAPVPQMRSECLSRSKNTWGIDCMPKSCHNVAGLQLRWQGMGSCWLGETACRPCNTSILFVKA